MSTGVVYYVNVQQHWSPRMTSWYLLKVCTASMCSNIDHLEWELDVYWRCVLRQSAATLITLNDILMSTGGCELRQCPATLITLNDTLMSIGGVYYDNVQQHWSPWMTYWCLLEVCTTSMCNNIDHLEWDHHVYWRCVLRQSAATLITLNDILMSTGGCVLRQCSATLITLNDTLMSIGGCVLHQCAVTLMTLNDILMSTGGCVLQQCAATLITLNDTLMSIGGVYYINVQQHWSPWMTSWCLMEVCTTSISSNTDHFEWDLDVYWRCVLRLCAATLITLNDILMSYGGCVLHQCAVTLMTLNDI
jgi:metal-sulfur cluster biosynthetic enzyme